VLQDVTPVFSLKNAHRILYAVLLAGGCAGAFAQATSPRQASSTSSAQAYPAKAVRFIVPTSPGGDTDVMARTLGQKLSEALAQRIWSPDRSRSWW
jgi:tripartite-type tricarboxylate transporter receptor subunit TctC